MEETRPIDLTEADQEVLLEACQYLWNRLDQMRKTLEYPRDQPVITKQHLVAGIMSDLRIMWD